MIAVAVVFAVLGAVCSAVGVRWQHAGVRAETGEGGLSLRKLGRLARNPVWLRGFGVLFACAVCQVLALTLAPVAVVAPIVVLALPVLALLNPRRLDATGWLAVAATTAAIAVFVARTAGEVAEQPISTDTVLRAGQYVAVAVVLLCAVAGLTRGLVRSATLAMAAGVAYGLVVVLVRDVTFSVRADGLSALPVLSLAGVVLAFLAGSWLIQLGYASGPPDIVVGAQTMLNPAVATMIGLGLLGEAGQMDVEFLATLVGCGAVAMTGVAVLARHHPDSAESRRRQPRRLGRPAAIAARRRSPSG